MSRQGIATVTIAWESMSNEDIEPGAPPDEGWYVTVTTRQVKGEIAIGPDFYGPGFRTFDEALRQVEKWATGRGLKIDTRLFTRSRRSRTAAR